MQAEQLNALFLGLERAYGTYRITGVNTKKNKAEGKATTLQKQLTGKEWQGHIDGKQGIGVVPITDNNTCNFAAIDVDIYDLDLAALEQKILTLGLPLVVCRTKSGGAHLYLFLSGPVAAVTVRSKMTQWAVALGFPGVEIFPKQDSLAGPEDVGNWINMPYFDADRTTRYCIHDGKSLSLDEFITYSESKRVDEDTLDGLDIAPADDGLDGAPPCLRTLAMHGVPEGTRNNALYNFAVLARLMKEDVDERANLLGQFNQDFMCPPLPFSEVGALLKSMTKKEYFYKCDQPPINSCCNKDLCRKANYGIGGNGSDPGVQIDGLSKICTDPPMWILQVSGARLQIETDDFINQQRFAKRCVEAINFFPMTLKPAKWKALINGLLKNVHEIEAPPDSGDKGQFLYHLEQFCTGRAAAAEQDELLLGKPWHDNGRTYFRAADFMKYLEQQRFRGVRGNQIYSSMREQVPDILHHFDKLKGKGVNTWSIPSFAQQTEDFNTPTVPDEEF